jgi:hypothetical protein
VRIKEFFSRFSERECSAKTTKCQSTFVSENVDEFEYFKVTVLMDRLHYQLMLVWWPMITTRLARKKQKV